MRLKFDIDPMNRAEINQALDILESLPNGQPLAHGSADASPSQTVHAATPENTLIQAQAAFGQPVAPLAPLAPIVALAPANPATGVEVPAFDSRGLPWDGRIHSVNKTRTPAGEWRKQRGVNDATVAKVEAELVAARAAAPVLSIPPVQPVAVPPVPVAPVPPAPGVPPPAVATAVAPPAPIPPVQPVAAPIAPVAPVTGEMDFVTLLKTVGQRSMTDQGGTQLLVNTALASVGLQEMSQLVQRPDLVMPVARACGFVA